MNDWEGIEAAVAVSDAGSFVGAAQLLNVSTSHVSRAIAQLEEKVGGQLYYRTTRKVIPSETGRSFIKQARRLLEERDDLFAFATGGGEPYGDLRITCSTSMGERFLANIVRRYMCQHPRVSVELELNNRIVDIVSEGFDLAIRSVDVADQRLAGVQIASSSISTVASPEYLERHGQPHSVDDLENHNCLTAAAGNWTFLEKGKPRIFGPKGNLKCNNGRAIVEAAIEHFGICQLPTFYVRDSIKAGTLVPILQDCESEGQSVWAVYPKRNHLLPKVRTIVGELQRSLQHHIDGEVSEVLLT